MNTYRNVNFTRRDYDCTNIVACVAESAPDENYALADASILIGLTHLQTVNCVRYYGYL